MSNLAQFSFDGNFIKKKLIKFSLFGMKLPKEGTELPKDGFDRIALNVILKGPKKVKF